MSRTLDRLQVTHWIPDFTFCPCFAAESTSSIFANSQSNRGCAELVRKVSLRRNNQARLLPLLTHIGSHSLQLPACISADRRPIDPAPIVQLRVVVHPPSKQSSKAKFGAEGKSERQARYAGDRNVSYVLSGESVITQSGKGWEDRSWYLENPYYFMCAMLADAERDEELHLLSDGKTRYTTGSCVSCLYHLKDIDGSHQGFFVFPDLSIRIEGRYRLKLCLFETIGNEVHHCKSIYTSPFVVYTAKRFPGMEGT